MKIPAEVVWRGVETRLRIADRRLQIGRIA
jgi:hypothetical protein